MRFKKGELYKIRFYDHAIGIDRAVECEIVGWVVKSDKICVCFSHWLCDFDDSEVVENNLEFTVIVKRAIIGAWKLNAHTQN